MSDARGLPVTVVVPTKDRPELLDGCLRCLRSALSGADELIVVDSASVDPAVAATARSHGARYLRCDLPGASRARNLGWHSADNEVIAFVDDDIRVDEGWAGAIADAFAASEDVAFVTGSIRPPEGPRPARPVAMKEERDASDLDASTTGVIGHSANLALRRSVLLAVDGFDEELGAGARFRAAEDLDLFDRVFAAGFRGRYEPAAGSVHVHWRDRTDNLRLEWAYGVGGGARAAKLARTDRDRYRPAIRASLWEAGVVQLRRAIRFRHRPGIELKVVRTAGTLVGLVSGRARPVVRGHFSPRRYPPSRDAAR